MSELNKAPEPPFYIMLDVQRRLVENFRHGPGAISNDDLMVTLDVLEKMYPESKELIDKIYGRKDNST